jgi:hypothetical protein
MSYDITDNYNIFIVMLLPDIRVLPWSVAFYDAESYTSERRPEMAGKFRNEVLEKDEED